MKNMDMPLRNVTIHPTTPKLQTPSLFWGGRFKNKDHSLFYVLEGAFALNVDEHHYIVHKDQLALMPRGHMCACWRLPDVELQLIDFSFYADYEGQELFSYFDCASDNHVVSIPDRREEIIEIYNTMTNPKYISSTLPHYLWLSANIAKLCAIYMQARISLAEAKIEFFEVISYMRSHLTEDIPLELLAESMHLNPAYFSAKFKKETGISPMRYFAQLRAQEAARLLLETDMSPAVIGKQIGISDIFYFRRFFEKHMGIRPEKYRDFYAKPETMPFFDRQNPNITR